MLGAAAASLIAAVIQQRKLEDPEDATVVELENLSLVCKLRQYDQYLLRTIRQSGNLQKDDFEYYSPQEAVRAAVATFRRARIEYAVVVKNTETEFVFQRPYHSHRGRQEGKKVSRVEIYGIGSQQSVEPEESPIIITPSYSCGCRGCGEVIPARTQIVITSRGPFHVTCAPKLEG